MDDTFEYNAEYGVMFCIWHYTGVWELATHLHKQYNLGKERRKPLLEKYRHLLVQDSKDIELPEPRGPAFTALGKPLEGF